MPKPTGRKSLPRAKIPPPKAASDLPPVPPKGFEAAIDPPPPPPNSPTCSAATSTLTLPIQSSVSSVDDEDSTAADFPPQSQSAEASSKVSDEKSEVSSSSSSSVATSGEEDLKVAENIAKSRGLPPDIQPEAVREFLLQYGYDADDHRYWGKPAEQQPELSISLTTHIEFGGHTQYELICKVLPRQGMHLAESSWRTLRRLKHIRAGLHDPVERALGSRYKRYFGVTPFAIRTAPAGTTARLQKWFASLAACINSSALEPRVVAMALRLFDGPGTPLHAHWPRKVAFLTSKDFEQIPVTAAMFGSKHGGVQQGEAPPLGGLPMLPPLVPKTTFDDGPPGFPQVSSNPASVLKATFDDAIDAAPLEVVFRVNGRDQSVQICKRPLGAEFIRKESTGAVKIARLQPQSHATELGLEVGWTVKAVGGQDVRKKTFQQVQDAIKAGLMNLPSVV